MQLTDNPLISVIIPIYNVEKYLSQCLESIINQTYCNLEIICVNDGSTDNSFQIIQQYSTVDNRIIVINKSNSGVSSTRNAALKRVTGKYVIFVDSDDWLELDTCQIVVDTFQKYSVDVVLWTYVREHRHSSAVKKIFEEEVIFFDNDQVKKRLHRRFFGLYKEELRHPENSDAIVTVWGKCYKSELIVSSNAFFVDNSEVATCEDALFNIDVFQKVDSAIFINLPLYHYRTYNINSITAHHKDDLFDKWNVLFDKMEDKIKQNNLPDFYTDSLNNRIALSIIQHGFNILGSSLPIRKKVHAIKKILLSERYKKSYKYLELKYFPIHWKVYFWLAKHQSSLGVFFLSWLMKKMK